MKHQDDRRLLDAMRMSESLPVLSAKLRQAAAAWGFSDVHYAVIAGDTPLQMDLKFYENAGLPNHSRPPLSRIVLPLIDICKRKIAPVFWRSDEKFRIIQVFESTQPRKPVGTCGITVPIHGPNDSLGILTVSSRCAGNLTCGGDRLSSIHAMAVIVHEVAMRNCESTRFGLQYETVDVPKSAFAPTEDPTAVDTPTIH